ncbi:MAG: PKD domain-containing protein [Candidatus Kapabacteria bacterium]|nr:PKD domain-containing protein [Candidatus Kapabacteria bacterium]
MKSLYSYFPNSTSTLLKRVVFLLSLYLIIISCDSGVPVTLVDTLNNGTESVAESKSANIDKNGGSVILSDGTEVSVAAGVTLQAVTLTVKKMNKDNFFSADNQLSYDLSSTGDLSNVIVKVVVPKNLTTQKISVFRYNPLKVDSNVTSKAVSFDYDSISGTVTSQEAVYHSKAYSSKSPVIQASEDGNRWIYEWDKDIFPGQTAVLIQMPFYEQPGNSCGPTCGVMLAKAYLPYTSTTKVVQVCDYIHYLGVVKDAGFWPYMFLYDFRNAFHYFTGAGAASTSYLRLSALREKIIEELDKKHPIIVRLDYPGVGAHVIMIIGYKCKSPTDINPDIMIHNPQGTGTESMYTTHPFNWIFQDKSSVVAIQILYPTDPPHPSRALLTIGMPLGTAGEISFKVPKNDGTPAKYYIILDENHLDKKGYSWIWNRKNFTSIPDTATSLTLKLPLFDANQSSSVCPKVEIVILKADEPKWVYESLENIPNNSFSTYWYEKTIPLSDFRKNSGSKDYSIIAKVYDGTNYMDGFQVDVKIEHLTIQISPDNLTGDKGIEYSWTADSKITSLSNIRYEWDFGDKTPIQISNNSNQIKHTYSTVGNYNINLNVYDDNTNKLIVSATSKATIGANGQQTLANLNYVLIYSNLVWKTPMYNSYDHDQFSNFQLKPENCDFTTKSIISKKDSIQSNYQGDPHYCRLFNLKYNTSSKMVESFEFKAVLSYTPSGADPGLYWTEYDIKLNSPIRSSKWNSNGTAELINLTYEDLISSKVTYKETRYMRVRDKVTNLYVTSSIDLDASCLQAGNAFATTGLKIWSDAVK